MPDAIRSPFLRRGELARALSERGFPVSKATLETMATRGGGPPFRRFGRAVVYSLEDGLAWAEGRMSAPVRSTAELGRHRPKADQPRAA